MKKCNKILLCYFQISVINFVNIINAKRTCDPKCIFPFEYKGKNYTKCTKVDSDDPWCVTDVTLFTAADDWTFVNGTKIGWMQCSSSCDVEKDSNECDTSKCQFPFMYGKHIYHKCTTIDYTEDGWCVTNQAIFDADNQVVNLKGDRIGFDKCSRTCPFEHRVCEECEEHYYYENVRFSGCTTIDSDLWDEDRKESVPWCIVNQALYNLAGEEGWEYCSWECRARTESKTNSNVILAIFVSISVFVVGLILLIFIYKKCPRVNGNDVMLLSTHHDSNLEIPERLDINLSRHSNMDSFRNGDTRNLNEYVMFPTLPQSN